MRQRTDNAMTAGALLMYLYIFTSYIATDIYISTRVNSLFLFAFVGMTVLLILFRDRSFTATVATVWYLTFAVMSLLSGLYAPEFHPLQGTFYRLLTTLCLIICIQYYIRSEADFRRLGWAYALASLILVGILQVSGNLSGNAGDRLGETIFGNANIFADLMMTAVMYALWLLLYGSRNNWQRLLALGITAADMYALSLSGGRKFFVVPLLFFYLLLLFRADRRGRRHVVKYTLFFLAFAAIVWVVIMNVPIFYESIGVRMEGLIANMLGGKGDSSSERRELLRQLALEGWLERPLFGHGFDSFQFLSVQHTGRQYYSHCNYTELLYNNGIVGFLLYYSMYAWILRRAWKVRRKASQSALAFAVGVAVSLFIYEYGAVSYDSTSNIIMIVLGSRLLSERFLKMEEP